GALQLAAFRTGLLIARLARLLRGTRPLPHIAALVASFHALRLGGHRDGAQQHHGRCECGCGFAERNPHGHSPLRCQLGSVVRADSAFKEAICTLPLPPVCPAVYQHATRTWRSIPSSSLTG